MVTETMAQVDQASHYFDDPEPKLMGKLSARDDYIDTLKTLIEDQCHEMLMKAESLGKMQANYLRSMITISANLERIADFAVNILRQTTHMSDPNFTNDYDLAAFFHLSMLSLESVEEALSRRDLSKAVTICQAEHNIDKLYENRFARILRELKAGGPAQDLVTTLFICHYLERMGDSLQNIGEAIIFALVGEKMKIHQYEALSEGLEATGLQGSLQKVELSSIWGTRSGCRIGTAKDRGQPEDSSPVLFKQGNPRKLWQEREKLKTWDRLFPGLPPKVWGFQQTDEDNASLMVEFLQGINLQELILTTERSFFMPALEALQEVLARTWSSTRQDQESNAGFIEQIESRQYPVFRLHPSFSGHTSAIGELALPTFSQLVKWLRPEEKLLCAPFSVMIHGDFNLNNVIYDPAGKTIHYIDLHRSKMSDYAQDMSVFLVSGFRLPVFASNLRSRLNQTAREMYGFALEQAKKMGDETFQARLALGLSRSFFSSTRFEYNRKFAKEMFLRSKYLLEMLNAHRPRPWQDFQLPEDILYY